MDKINVPEMIDKLKIRQAKVKKWDVNSIVSRSSTGIPAPLLILATHEAIRQLDAMIVSLESVWDKISPMKGEEREKEIQIGIDLGIPEAYDRHAA